MIKRLTTHGNSLALVLDKAILDLLHISHKTPLEIATDGKNLIISPVRETGRPQKIQSAMEKVNKHHGNTFKKLAQ